MDRSSCAGGCVLILVALVTIGVVYTCQSQPSSTREQAAVPSEPKAVEVQAQAREDVDDRVKLLIKKRAVKSVDPEEMEAQVNPEFWYSGDLDAKRSVVKLLAMYCKKHAPKYGGAVTLKNSRTGRKLAEYSNWSGIKLAGED